VIDVLIVEDDFRVARAHAELAGRVEGFRVTGVVHTASAALSAVAARNPRLVLLDVYLPDASGLEVIRRLRRRPDPPDVIMLTAASDLATVREAMQAGALHYLVKPFDIEALRDRLRRYAELHSRRTGDHEVDQREIDRLFGLMRRPAEAGGELPKGRSSVTANLILQELRTVGVEMSAGEVAERIGVSRATAQRYLSALADAGGVRMRRQYGASGRPEHRYSLAPGPGAER
jgi:response regulator of citrate/malate metabolism